MQKQSGREMNRSIKVYDCFCYFNEDLLLELRLKTLWEVVDFFVIVEATYTQSGLQKPLNYSLEQFRPYAEKIRYLVSKECPGGTTDYWANENHQRNEIGRGLWDATPEDLIIVSDLDEIPNPQSIRNYDPQYIRGDFQQKYFSYYFNNQLIYPAKDRVWKGTKITTYKNFVIFFEEKANNVRSFKSKGIFRSLKRTFFRLFQAQKINNGGWHFTWIMSIDGILGKMDAMAHQENNRPELRDPRYIQRTIQAGRDIVAPLRRYSTVPLDTTFPYPLLEGSKRFGAFIRSADE